MNIKYWCLNIEYWILKTKYFASTRETCNTTLRSRVLVSKPRAWDLLSPQPTHTKKSSWIGNKKHTKCRTTWRLKLAQVFSEVKLVSFFRLLLTFCFSYIFFRFTDYVFVQESSTQQYRLFPTLHCCLDAASLYLAAHLWIWKNYARRT